MSSYGPGSDDRAHSPPPIADRERSRSRGRRHRGRSRSYSRSPDRRRSNRSRSRSRDRRYRDRSYSPPRGGRYRDDDRYDDRRPYPRDYRDHYPHRGGGYGYHDGPPPPHHHRDHHGPPPPHFDPYYRGPPNPGDRPGPPPGRRDRNGRLRDEGPPGVSLLIRNISPDIATKDLQQAFGRIGELRDVYIPRDYHSHQAKGFAFIEYATPAMAAEARDEMNRFVVKGRELEVVFAQERRKTPNEMRGRVVNQQNHRQRSSSFERHKQQQHDGASKDRDQKE